MPPTPGHVVPVARRVVDFGAEQALSAPGNPRLGGNKGGYDDAGRGGSSRGCRRTTTGGRGASGLVEQLQQVVAVAGLRQGLGSCPEAVVVDEAAAPGDLLRAADLQALAFLDRADELPRRHQRVECPGVQPGRPARQYLDLESLLAEVDLVHRRDLQLAARRRRDRLADLDHIRGVEV